MGKWLTYDTSLTDITNFVDKVNMKHDYNGFTGDRKFIRDEEAQKAFSKLRSSIAGLYEWRFRHARNATDQQRMLKEADFAYRQAFAYCPYSPEAVFHYVNLLLTTGRVDDAVSVGETCFRLDPNNEQVENMVKNLHDIKNQHLNLAPSQVSGNTQQLEKEVKDNPTDFQKAFNLAGAYIQLQQPDKAMKVLDDVLANPKVEPNAVIFLAKAYAQMGNYPKLEIALEKLTQLQPHSPEAWCDLAAMKIAVGKASEAYKDLKVSVDENAKRLAQNPKASNLLLTIRADPRFAGISNTPEFQQVVGLK